MKKLLIALMLVCGFGLVAPAPALAQTESSTDSAKESLCEGVGLTGGSCDDASGPTLKDTVETVINVLSFVVGIIAVIMIIIGGLKYITSAGDSNSVNSAKNTILYAFVGLVVVLMAQVLVRFVISTTSKVDDDTSSLVTTA